MARLNRKVYDDAYYSRNREKVLARNKAWEKANPEKIKAIRGRMDGPVA